MKITSRLETQTLKSCTQEQTRALKKTTNNDRMKKRPTSYAIVFWGEKKSLWRTMILPADAHDVRYFVGTFFSLQGSQLLPVGCK